MGKLFCHLLTHKYSEKFTNIYMEDDNNQGKFSQIITTLFEKGCCEFDINDFHDEEDKYKYEILKLICGTGNEEKGIFQIHNLINIIPRNCLVQQKIMTFLENMRHYSIEELIIRYDTISKAFYELKMDKRFIVYLEQKKNRFIPFFNMLGFCAYMNIGKDISGEIIKLIKKNYIKKIIGKYINEMRKSLFNIILYYYKIILINCNEGKNSLPESDNLLYTELKNSLQRYICFNELFDEGEIVKFVNCLYKTITKDAKPIYLKQGPDISLINNIIKYIFEQILDNFELKNYYEKTNMNNLYDLISAIINNLSEETLDDNYAKFITKYCQYYKQGNKNIVISFFSGLNPDNFKKTFNNLNFNGNEDYYDNIKFYIGQISHKKKKKSKKENPTIQINNSNNETPQNKNSIKIKQDTIHDTSKNDKNINASINIENVASIDNNKILDVNNSEKQKSEELMKEFQEMKNEIKLLKEKNQKMEDIIENMSKENNKIKNEFNKFKDKAQFSQVEIKTELFKLKKEIKQISYRDISKLIINNYINKYKNRLEQEKNLKTKKDKAMAIIKYLVEPELTYYNKIVNKYYDSNYLSHISKIFKDFGMNYIIGLKIEKNEIIDKIFIDYCKIILEEKINFNNNNTLIEELFGLKKIIKDLAEKQMLNYYYF